MLLKSLNKDIKDFRVSPSFAKGRDLKEEKNWLDLCVQIVDLYEGKYLHLTEILSVHWVPLPIKLVAMHLYTPRSFLVTFVSVRTEP